MEEMTSDGGRPSELMKDELKGIASRLKTLLFTPKTEEDINWLTDNNIPIVNFHTGNTNAMEEFHAKLIKDLSVNKQVVPEGFSLPAIQFMQDQFRRDPVTNAVEDVSRHIASFGIVPSFFFDKSGHEFVINTYWLLNEEGQAFRKVEIERVDETAATKQDDAENPTVVSQVLADRIDELHPVSGKDVDYLRGVVHMFENGFYDAGRLYIPKVTEY